MTPVVEVLSVGDTLAAARDRLERGHIRHLPVVEDEKLIGLVSIGDLVKIKLEETAQEAQALRQYISS